MNRGTYQNTKDRIEKLRQETQRICYEENLRKEREQSTWLGRFFAYITDSIAI